MSTADSFWPRRLRWRLLGAWRWPLFVALTVADGFIAHALPPTGARAQLIPALIICSFANLFLVGVVAPWLARMTTARRGDAAAPATFPPSSHGELLTDRIAAAALVIGTIGIAVAGALNNVPLDRSNAAREARIAAQTYVAAHAPMEIKQHFLASNTYELQPGVLFRICTPYNDARKAYCLFVNVKRHPPSVRLDGDSRPNGMLFPGLGGSGI